MHPVFCNRNDKDYQRKLNALLSQVFFDFTFWYDLDLWDDRYESYAFEEEGSIVSNICVYRARLRYQGQELEALSIGGVATHPRYRGQGLSRRLMQTVLDRYPQTPMYLGANDSVLDFYPKFGFRRSVENRITARVALENRDAPRLLAHDDPKVWDYVAGRQNFAGGLDCLNTRPIELFHLYSGEFDGHICDLPEIQTMVVARQEGERLHIAGVFSGQRLSFAALAARLPFTGVEELSFGFLPPWQDLAYESRPEAPGEGNNWYVRGEGFGFEGLKFPEMSET